MSDYDLDLFERYSTAGILVDSNLMLLFFVGSVDRKQITRFKRTRAMFAEEDYDALMLILEQFRTIVVTPNILTEVNSFLNQLVNALKPDYFTAFAGGIASLVEVYVPSIEVSNTIEFVQFGLTDAGIALLARDKYLVLTADSRLAVHLQANGVDAINFNHFRNYI